MNDAANLSNSKLEDKLSIIKTKLPNVDENKLKSLEARFLGPSANGNLPYEFESIVDVDFDFIKSKLSNKSEINSVNNDSQNGNNFVNNNKNEVFEPAGNEDNLGANNVNVNSNKSYLNNLNNSNNMLSNGNNNIVQRNSARKKNESQKAEKTTKNVGEANIEFLAKKRVRNEIFNSQNNNSNSGMFDSKNNIRENNNATTDKKADKPNFENSKKQSLNIHINSNDNNNNNFNNLNMLNSPSSNKAKKPLNTNSNNNLISISSTNPLNNLSIDANNNNNINKKSAKENTSSNNKSEKNQQQQLTNISNQNIQSALNPTNNLNNIGNLNNVINIQNANFISTLQDLSHGGSQQSEENIEFSSKNICSNANLFYKSKDSGNNNNPGASAKQANNPMKNQTILDQFNIKAFANPAAQSRNNDMKINSYFNKTGIAAGNNSSSAGNVNNHNNLNLASNSGLNTNNNLNHNNGNLNTSSNTPEDKSIKLLKQNYLKSLEDNEKLVKDLGDKNRFILEKEKESEKLKLILIENEQSLKSLSMLNKSFESQINLGKNSLIKYLKEFEELKRKQNKVWLNEQAYRLGKFSIQRMGHRVIEAWEDGEEINNVKNSIKQIKETKEDLEKLKKRLAAVIKKKEATINKEKEKEKEALNSSSSGFNTKENSNFNNFNKDKGGEAYTSHLNNSLGLSSNINSGANAANNFLHPMNIFHSNNLFTYGHNGNLEEYTEHEMLELRELISFKLTQLNKEETECLEKLEKLEIQKIKYQIEFKRNMEEEKCRYGGNSKEKWPVLSNRYLILSLLGRGGYSEVYKAYDLENHIEVACKIHQLNPAWTDSIKENYIRHTIRENQIHKEISHPKVVKHYDTIEIDTSSFCTVLELCSGPDLYTYLKLNKTLSEKDARIIISQILSGVEYLNKLQKKIIHYDLKPQNIIFNNMEVKISDFGLAKIMEDNSDKIELTSQGVGTYWYLPPECFDTDKNPPGISSKVDVWSIGVILYELVFGVRPFGHSLTQDRILKENVISNAKKVEFPQKPAVSEECKDFIKNCLAHNQDERYNVFEALESNFIKCINPKRAKTN